MNRLSQAKLFFDERRKVVKRIPAKRVSSDHDSVYHRSVGVRTVAIVVHACGRVEGSRGSQRSESANYKMLRQRPPSAEREPMPLIENAVSPLKRAKLIRVVGIAA